MLEQVAIILVLFTFVAVGLSARLRHETTVVAFSTKRNSISAFVTAAGVSMTFVGGAALVNMASLGYTFGWYTLVDPISAFIGIFIATLLVGNFRKDNGVTMAELLSSNYPPLAFLIGTITSTVFLLITAAQFVAFSKLLSPFFPGIDPKLMMLFPALVVSVYVFAGGFYAVTRTDVLQLMFVLICLLLPMAILVLNGVSEYPGEHIRHSNAFTQMPLNLMILLSISILYIPVSQDMNIRAKSAATHRTAVIGFISGAALYVLIVFVSIYMGITLNHQGVALDDPESAFSYFFKTYFPAWGILPIIAGMAAIWSTLDTYLMNTMTSIAEDVLRRTAVARNASDRTLLIVAGGLTFGLAMLIAIFFFTILTLVLSALLIYISVLIPVALGKRFKLHDRVILYATLIVIVVIVTSEVLKLPVNPKAFIYPAFGAAVMGSLRLFTRLRSLS